jgi:outer membrane protein assembly factor BamB
MWVRERWKPLLAVALLLLAALVYVGQDRWRDRCGAAADELAPDDVGPALQPPDELDPNLRDRLTALPAPFGDVVAGREWKSFTSRPSVGEIDDDTIYLAAGGGLVGTEYAGSVVAADVSTGKTRWGVGVKGYGAGGGPVGDSFVTLGVPEDKAPQLAAYDAGSGERQSCTKLGDDTESGDDPALASDTVGDDDVVVAREDEHDDAGLVVTRLDPRTGDEAWSVAADIGFSHPVVDDTGGGVVISGVPADRPPMPSSFGNGQVVGLTALDAEDGSAAWTWPADAPEGGTTSVKVVGTDPDAGRVYAIEAVRGADAKTTSRLVALDDQGAEVWAEPLAADYCEAGLWDELVVTSCGEPAMAAYDAATGSPRWTSPTEIRIVGGVIRLGPGRSVDLGDGSRLQLANDGLLRVDTATGEITPAVTEEELGTYVSGIDLVGDHLVLSTETGVYALAREDG